MVYSPFCVPAKVTKLIGVKRPPFSSPTNLIIFAHKMVNRDFSNNSEVSSDLLEWGHLLLF
jgi:hypothetical protein